MWRSMAAFTKKTQLYSLFWLRFYIKNAAKTWPMAAFFVENAAIVIRPSAGETKCGDLWLRLQKKRSYMPYFGCVF